MLATLQDDVCRPAVIEEAIRLAMCELPPANRDKARERLTVDLAAAREECNRLAEAIGRGGPLDALLTRLTDQQARCAAIEREIQQHTAETPRLKLAGLETRIRPKLADWRGLLRRNVQDARAALRALLTSPLRFTPIVDDRRRGYAFTGTVALDKLLAGVVELPTKMASPNRICKRVGGLLRAA